MVNLTNKEFDHDRNMVIYRGLHVGVTKTISIGSCLRSSIDSLEISKKYPNYVYATIGIHPHNARFCNRDKLNKMEKLLENKEVLAVGICGLDYEKKFSNPLAQKFCFEEQLKLAVKVQKPVVLYERGAYEDFVDILRKYIDNIPGAIVQSFDGNNKILNDYMGLGCYIGVSGLINDPKRGKDLREVCKNIPMDRLIIQTDSPYHPHTSFTSYYSDRDKRNEPCKLPLISQKVANLSDKKEDEIANISRYNMQKLFGL